MKKYLLFLLLLAGVAEARDQVWMNQTNDEDIVFKGKSGGVATELIRIDASNNAVGFPEKVHITGEFGVGTTDTSTYNAEANDVVIRNAAGGAGMTISTNTSAIARILFQDNTGSTGSGSFKYQNSNNKMSWGTASIEDRMTLDADGDLGVGTTDPIVRGMFRADGGVITGMHADTVVLAQRSNATDANAFFTAVSGTTGVSGIYFGPVDNADQASLTYDADTDEGHLRSNDTVVLTASSAGALSGNGSGFTNLDAGNISAGTLAVARGGTGTTTSTGTGSVVLSTSPTFTTQILLPDGTASLPSMAFGSDPDTGIDWLSSGSFRLVANTVNVIGTNSSGNLDIFTQQIIGDTLNPLRLRTRGDFRVNLDRLGESSGQIFGVTADNTEDLVWSVQDSGDMVYETPADQVLHKRTASRFLYNFYHGVTFDINDDGSGASQGFRIENDGTLIAAMNGNELEAGLRNDLGSGTHVCHSNSGGVGTYNECSSAERYKKNFEPITLEQVEAVYKSEPLNFEWKHNDDDDAGFIADNMVELFPRLVSWSSAKDEDGNNMVQGFNYSGYTAVLTKVAQMHKEEIDEVKAENALMKAWICAQDGAPEALCPAS